MGRTEFLARLALGRSAMQNISQPDPSPDEGTPLQRREGHDIDRSGFRHRIQQFDQHGRPINPAVEAHNIALRRAQNTVLALVGVIEDREAHTAPIDAPCPSPTYEVPCIPSPKSDYDLAILWTILYEALIWWTDMVVQARLATGLESTLDPLSSFFFRGNAHYREHGLVGLIEAFQPGAIAYSVYALSRIVLCNVTEFGAGRIQQRIIAQDGLTRQQARQLHAIINGCRIGCRVAIDAALLPLSYFASAQALGLLPVFPTLPLWSQILPWSSQTLHLDLWASPVQVPLLGIALSAGALKLILSVSTDIIKVRSRGANFRSANYPEPENQLQKPIAQVCCDWMGLSRQYDEGATSMAHSIPIQFQSEFLSSGARLSTAVSGVSWPATIISYRLHSWILMPLINTASRAVAWSFLQSRAACLGLVERTDSRLQRIYTPFGGGPLGRFFHAMHSPAHRLELGRYFQKIGLCMAVQATVDATILVLRVACGRRVIYC